MIEKGQDHIGGKMLDSERGDFYGKFLCRKRQKQGKDISIRFDGLIAATLYTGQVQVEESIDINPAIKYMIYEA